VEWASTISSWLIRNIYWTTRKRNFKNKAREFFYAIIINIKFSKNQILTAYLNSIYFWNSNYWLNSASNFYFQKKLKNLTKAEQIALLTIPKNPTKYNPISKQKNFRQRFEKLVDYFYKKNLISKNEKISILNEKLFFKNYWKNLLPYVIDFVKTQKKYKQKDKIFLTIDYNLTQQIKNLAKNIIIEKVWKNMQDYWLILIDKETKEILVMIWGYNYNSKDWQVNATLALRQAWSTIKAFTYLLAIKDLWYSPSTIILDLPTQFKTKEWYNYSPKNYSLKYSWKITLAQALSQSINVVSVKLLDKIWVQRLLDFLKKLKISSLNKDASYYWLALTLWVWEVSLFELTRAYTIFAYDWYFCNIKIFKNENVKCEKIIEKKYTDQIKLILTNRYFKLAWFPINSTLDFSKRKIFVKTWTSRNFRDNWAIWFSKNYILWVWAWNKDGSPMLWVSWASWAWEIFSKVIKFLEKPEENIKEKIIFKEKKINFLEIISPLNNSIFQIDNSIDLKVQKIKLDYKTDIDFDYKKFFINNKEINSNFWQIKKWNFVFEIILYKNNKEIKRKKSFFIVK
jgi:membrane carboxypeptidase/penicillin-binding protein PbpC